MRPVAFLIIVSLIAVACSGGASTPELIGRGLLGGTDTDKLNVPLEDVYVDTFTSGSIPLSEIEAVSRATFAILESIETGAAVDLASGR